jgi:hypothetical protein
MKSTLFSGLLAALAVSTTVSAQEYNQTGPFSLKIRSETNATLDGSYLTACHAGAAIEGLCLGGKTAPNATTTYATYYYNYTTYDGTPSDSGVLIWNLPYTGPNGTAIESESMTLGYNPGSNVAFPLFEPSYTNTQVGFNGTELFIPSPYDDSTFTPGKYPTSTGVQQLKNWYVCWGWVGGYYYQAVAWVTAEAPHNPTCQKVCIEKEDV